MSRTATLAAVMALAISAAGAQQPGSGGMSPPAGAPPGGSPPPGTAAQGTQQRQGARPDGQGGSFVAVAKEEARTTYIGVAGRLEPARRIGHTASAAGVVAAVHVRVGDRVSEGQPLVTIVRDAPGESYRPVVVASRVAGRVSAVGVTQGAEVKSGAEAVTVIDDSEFRLVAALSDKDAFRVASMARAAVTARSADGVTLRGTLEGVSAEPDYSTGLFSAVIGFPAQAGARIGMVLLMDLPVESVRGVFVDKDLIVRRFGRSVMWVFDEAGALRQVPVTPGKPYGDDILLTSGLVPGTRYVAALTGYEKDGMSLEEYREARKKGS